MIKIDFLEAASGHRLSKTHTADANGLVTTDPYPLVKMFTSHQEDVSNTTELMLALEKHANLGHCALKGNLSHQLVKAERKGTTSTTDPTQWLCLDLDFDKGFADIDAFMAAIGLDDVSYVFQHSNSAGVKGVAGLRGHVFVLLDTPVSPITLKEWLKELNLTVPELTGQLELAKNGHSLIWPLDVSTCQNDKLSFIAPPTFNNMTAPITSYFVHCTKHNDTARLNPAINPAKNKAEVDKTIKALRAAGGLPIIKARTKAYGVHDILVNPDPMMISETQDHGDFVRCNLVGDNPSWGYYYEKSNPDLLLNFKGAPPVMLRDADPVQYQVAAKQLRDDQTQSGGKVAIAFRHRESDNYYNGFYDVSADALDLSMTSSAQKINDFLETNHAPALDAIEDWGYDFDPTTTLVIDPTKQWANKFSPTSYIQATTLDQSMAMPTQCEKIIRSICTDQPTYEHFINWLAWIFQNRKKAKTAWLFSGIEGTGKGLLAAKILQPLFGRRYVVRITPENLDDLFNANFEEALFVFVDEFNLKDAKSVEKVYNKLKNLITEESLTIRAMRTNAYDADSYLNVVMATNTGTTLPVSSNDRRINVAPSQTRSLPMSEANVDAIEGELEELATFLRSYVVDVQKTRDVLMNQARQELIGRGRTADDEFFLAIKEGNLQYFADMLGEANSTSFDLNQQVGIKILEKWAVAGVTCATIAEAREMYTSINGRTTPTKFSKNAQHHALVAKPTRVDGKVCKAYPVTWHPVQGTMPVSLSTQHNVTAINGDTK